MKQLVVSLEPMHIDWVKKGAKEQKISVSEFVRSMVDFLQESNPREITAKLAKSRLESEIQAARQRADEAIKHAEKLTAQREKLEKQLVEAQ